MQRTGISAALMLLLLLPAGAQNRAREFRSAADSVSTLLKERTSVAAKLSLKTVTKRDDYLDFYFTDAASDIPWRSEDVSFVRKELKNQLPAAYAGCKIGRLFVRNQPVEDLIIASLTSDGTPPATTRKVRDLRGSYVPIVRQAGGQRFAKGLSDRHIALWQSHGRYYESKTRRWEWQRSQHFMTVEDMYTQSYVLPFLIPMLENAGAYVMTPRERDTQIHESIADNDPAFGGRRSELLRTEGKYSESGRWEDAGVGFADAQEVYYGEDNPFLMGTARMTRCGDGDRQARWTPDIPERGVYSVYVAYKSLPNSTTAARYTVRHLGGETSFYVNQKMGGGTWIYLGSFEFDKGGKGAVILDNGLHEGAAKGSCVTADAVRFGGGMGKVARGEEDEPYSEWSISGMPSYLEGAMYWMQWAGIDTTITRAHETDYTNDYADRGPWVGLLAGGSPMNPDEPGKGIPVDLSMAWHTDAGVTPDDEIVGTLSIYTLLADGSRTYPSGEDRLAGRELADMVQSQIVDDVRKQFNPDWTRRMLWDRSYSESRTPPVPALLLELLSHQNFADMKYGLDPTFRFGVARAVYKGMLKFLSARYGAPYAVQPLPVEAFSASLSDGSATLSWKAVKDSLEATADPSGYILYTRIDDGAFDTGRVLGDKLSETVSIEPGHLYSFKVVAYNEGGRSFPSEVLSVGLPSRPSGDKVLVVNNFDRVSAPTWFDTPTYAGFDTNLDGGVAWGYEINYCGDQYQFLRSLPWTDDDNPGYGGSYNDYAGKKIAGNTFDFVSIHARAILEAGYPVCSASMKAFAENEELSGGVSTVDLLCGKQVTTSVGRGGDVPDRYQVWPESLQSRLRNFTSKGGNILVSGGHIGTDVWEKIYPAVQADSAYTADTKQFIEQVLGFTWLTNYGSRSGKVVSFKGGLIDSRSLRKPFEFWRERNEQSYCIETPDGLMPAGESSSTFLRYADTNISAAVCFEGEGYRCAAFGFPLELIKDSSDLQDLTALVLAWLSAR